MPTGAEDAGHARRGPTPITSPFQAMAGLSRCDRLTTAEMSEQVGDVLRDAARSPDLGVLVVSYPRRMAVPSEHQSHCRTAASRGNEVVILADAIRRFVAIGEPGPQTLPLRADDLLLDEWVAVSCTTAGRVAVAALTHGEHHLAARTEDAELAGRVAAALLIRVPLLGLGIPAIG